MITTCVILNYNDSKTTLELVDNIKSYESIDYIIIVDNDSNDGSFDILKKYESKKIHVLSSDKNGGYGYGNNVGIRYSYEHLNSYYTLLVNPDVFFSNQTVVKLREALKENNDTALCAAVPLKPNGEKQARPAWKLPSTYQIIFGASIILNKITDFKIEYKDLYKSQSKMQFVDVVQGSLLMVKTQLMINYGMYDEEFFLYEEEQVIAKRLKDNGYKSILLLNETYIHNHSVTISKEFNSMNKRRSIILSSKLLYLKKYNNVNKAIYYLAKIFFKLLIVESCIVSLIIKMRNKGQV